MGRASRLLSAGLLVGIALILHSEPARANQCIVGCHGMKTSKGYAEGQVYTYNFVGKSTTAVSGAEGESTVKLSGVAELAVKPDCVHQLKLKDVQLNGAPVSQSDVEKHALQFNYHDGHIDTSICAEPGDSQASLNIKRAIISLFQSTVQEDNGVATHRETDIFGSCPTDFETNRAGNALHVHKSRNLERCSYRESMGHGIIQGIYDDSSDIKSSPVLSSHQYVNQVFENGILNYANSTETYFYQPFSNGDAGAKITVVTSITSKSNKADTSPSAPVSLSKSLVFDPPHPVTTSSSSEAIVKALKMVKDQSSHGVKSEAAEKFGDLVKILKKSNKNDIQSIYNMIKSGGNGFDKNADKKILLDALYRTGSGEAVEVIAELIKNKEVSGIQALAFYASLALIHHVSPSSVSAATSLLDQSNLPRIAYLGIGRIVGKYCQQHECENVPEVNNAMSKISEKIGDGKAKERHQENIIIAALKAVRNSQYLNEDIMKKIVAIAKDKTIHTRVRVTAIEALIAKCSMKWKTPIIDIFGDHEEDSEIRIKAYLSLVECSCPHVANSIKKIIDVETVNQVGSFVTSHLRNLRASTDPSKQHAKRHLSEVKPIKKFPEDFRKFSFNNEFSYNIDALGIGSSMEQNVIYSQKSFVPRSVNLNLTTELFGRSFNFMEIDIHAENLDKMIEYYFGPKGVIAREALPSLIMLGKEGASDMYDHVKERVEKLRRGRRNAIKQADLDKFAKNAKPKSTEIDDDLSIDLSLKLFGVELAYVDFRDSTTGRAHPNVPVDNVFNFLDYAFDHMKNFDYHFSRYIHLIDLELVYPTGLGFPLSVGIEGNGVVQIKANGKIDVPAILNDPHNAAIKIGLEPSANIAVTASLTFDTFGAESGMKVISRLHTATGSDLSISVLDGKGVDIKFGLPKKKQEIINMSNQVLFFDDKNNVHEPKFPKGQQQSDCLDQFSQALGITICEEYSYPSTNIATAMKRPFVPLSSPCKIVITVENNDVTSLHFRTFYNVSADNQQASFEATFDTPNSRTNRKVALGFNLANKPTEKYIEAFLKSPIKNIDGKLSFENTDEKKMLILSLHHDAEEFLASIGLVANGNKYTPKLEYKVPDHIEKLVSGKESKSDNKPIYKLGGDITISNEDGGNKCVFDKVTLYASGKSLVSLDGYAHIKPDEFIIDAKVSHNDDNLGIKFDGKRLANGFDINTSLIPSKDPNIGFKIIWHFDASNSVIDHSFIYIYGADLESKTQRLTITDRLSYKNANNHDGKFQLSALNYKSEMTWPSQDMAAKSEIDYEPNDIETEFDVKYGNFKIGSKFEYESSKESPGNWKTSLGGHLSNSKFSVVATQRKASDNMRKVTAKFETPGGKYEMDATNNYQVDGQNADVKFNLNLNLNGKILKSKNEFIANVEKIDVHSNVLFDNAEYLNFILKLQRGTPMPHGNLMLNMKNYLMVSGQFDYKQGKGAGNLVMTFPKLQRKVTANGDIAITGIRHVANIEILLDAEKDKSKYIKFSTDSEMNPELINSKNVIDLFSYKTELDINGHYKDKKKDGYDVDGSIHFTLPSGNYFVTSGKQIVDHKSEKTSIHNEYDLMHYPKKGGKSQSLSYKSDINFNEPKRYEYNVDHKLKLINLDGNDIQLNVVSSHAKTTPEKRKGNLHVGATGSYLPKPFSLDFNVDYTNKHELSIPHETAWDFKSSLGDDFSAKGNGKFSDGVHLNKPRSGEIDFIFVLPWEKLRNFKYQGSMKHQLPNNDQDKMEYEYSGSLTYNDDQNIKVDVKSHQIGFEPMKKKSGKSTVTLNILSQPPFKIDTSYEHDPTGELHKGNGKFQVNYGDKITAIEIDSTYLPNMNNLATNIKAKLPYEKLHFVEFGFAHNREESGVRKYDAHLIADKQKYDLTSEFEINPSLHRSDIVFTCPEGKTEISAKVQKLDENEYKAEWKIMSPKGFVVADGHVKADNFETFIIQINFDSDKIQHRKIHAEITTTPAVKTGKRIILTITSDGKNIITGSTSYSKREEPGQMIIEGNGSLKIGETNTRSSKFTFSRKQLIRENDGETGVAMLLNANFGPSAVVGDLKLSDKEVLVFTSYCEQSKDCAHFKLQATIDADHKSHFNHQIIIEVDLKKFNLPVEFGLKSTTKYHPKEFTFDHSANLYLHTSKDKTQYSSEIYIHPRDAAVVLTIPSRELALLISTEIPKARSLMGPYKLEISVYLDRKNKPNEKTGVIINGDINVDKNTADISNEARLIYPAPSTKDMVIKSKVHYGGNQLLDANFDIDVFAKKTQKIVISAHINRNPVGKGYNYTSDVEINSRGQQLKINLKEHVVLSPEEIGFGSMLSYTDENQKPKNVGVLFSLNAHESHFFVQAPNQDLIKSDTTISIANNLQKIQTEFILFDNAPVVISFETHDMNSFKYQSYQKDKPDTKLVVTGRAIIGQVADLHADAFKNGEKKHLFTVGINFDDKKYIKPELNYNKENVAALIDFYRDRFAKSSMQLKDAIQAISNEAITEFKDFGEHLKKAQPNWKPIIQYYQSELEKLEQELNADTTIKEIQATLNKVFGGLITVVTKVLNQLTERMAELGKEAHELLQKIIEAMKNSILPRMKESMDKILQAGFEVADAASKLAATYLKTILTIINDHQKELKELMGALSELTNDIIKIIVKGWKEVEDEIKNTIGFLVQQVRELPIYDFIKEKYTEILNYQIPDVILDSIQDALVQFKRLLPTKELREFFSATYNYIMMHVKRQKVDDDAELKNIYSLGIDAIESIIHLLRSYATADHLYDILNVRLHRDMDYLKHLPGFPILKISIWNMIKNREIPSIVDMYYAYRPTMYPSDIIPPFSKGAIVVEGGHFFTFDGRHISMTGTCDYILSQDVYNGNFSIVGSFNNGKLISVTITAPGESITLKSNGNILVDNKPAEYPVSTKNLHAFFTLPIVNVKSDYGVHIACAQKAPMICGIHVSGFYHDRLRGIFGNANNEGYDDFTLPSGHVTEGEADFGNAYRLNPSCAAAPAIDHHSHNHNPTCTEYFASDSSMSSCFNYVDPKIYRQACDHAMSAGTPRAACLISSAYYAACRKERVSITIPPACGSCKAGKDEVSIGDSFSVKIPKKEADIVFVVEQESKNEKIFKELITPLMTELKTELSQHGITDVHIGLIGYGEHLKWPQHYTTNGNLNIDGPVKNIEFAPNNPKITLDEARDGDVKTRLKYIEQRLDVELGRFKLTDAYEEAINYPYRVGAAKAVVGVFSSPCEKSPLPISLQQFRLLLGRKIYHDLGLTYNHISYLGDVMVSGKPQKNVVGYDAHTGYTFSDSKKKPLEGSIDKNNLVLTTTDVCAEFAVSSGGAVFSSDHFLDGKPNQKKQFIQIAARKLANSLASMELEEDCVCTQEDRIDGQAECEIVGRREKEIMGKHTKGVKG